MSAFDEPPARNDAAGVGAVLARLAESVVGLARTRGELAAIELVEERERLLLRLVLVIAGIVIVAFALLFAGALVIVLFWDTHRLAAIAGVAIVHLVAGAAMILRARAIGRSAPTPFSATLAELEKDRMRLARAVSGPEDEP